MLQELDGKVAVITGGGSGIGASLARACAAAGMKVVVVDVNEERVTAVAAELPAGTAAAGGRRVGRHECAGAGGLRLRHVRRGAPALQQRGRLPRRCACWDFTDDEWQWLLGVNVRGVANGIRSFVPRMIAQGEGHIVNTGSGASFVSTPRLGPYCATKLRDRRALGGAALRARRHRHRGERARPRRREHEHRRLDGPTFRDRPRRDHRRLHGAHRRASTRPRSP